MNCNDLSKIKGTPEWFSRKAKEGDHFKYSYERENELKNLRKVFVSLYSPEKLEQMSPEDLLVKIFGKNENSMVSMLIGHGDYGHFGWTGVYTYLRILFKNKDGDWVFYKNNKSNKLTYDQALAKANEIRNSLIEYAEIIDDIGEFRSIANYQKLERRVRHIFFYKYNWVLKYFQMLYPEIFSCIYADGYLKRALDILGLKKHSSKLLNNGELALFNRRCSDVPNHALMQIFGVWYGW